MKKGIFGFVAVILAVLALLPAGAFAAGTVTADGGCDTDTKICTCTITWTADAAAATVPTTNLLTAGCPGINGYLVIARVGTGATAPTALYDITLTTPAGTDTVDVMGGALKDLSQAGGEQRPPQTEAGTPYPVPVDLRAVSFALANNAVNSATGVVVISVQK